MSALATDGTYKVDDRLDCDIPSGRWESAGAQSVVCTFSRRTTMLIRAGHATDRATGEFQGNSDVKGTNLQVRPASPVNVIVTTWSSQ